MKYLKLLCATAAMAFSVSTSANFVDLFSDPLRDDGGRQTVKDNQNVTDPLTYDQTGATDTAENFEERGTYDSVIGGYRDLKVLSFSGADGTSGTCIDGDSCARASIKAEDQVLSASFDDPVHGVTIVQWDGMDGSGDLAYTGLQVDGVGEDLVKQDGCPTGGCDRFQFEVVTIDNRDFLFSIGIWTDETHYKEFVLASSGTPGPREIFFDFFTDTSLCDNVGLPDGVVQVNCGADGAANVNDVGAMQIVLDTFGGVQAIDLSIGGITKTGVPEPEILALLGIGLAVSGIGTIRRRRKSKS